MPKTNEMPSQEETREPVRDDWPELIYSPVFLRMEHGHWVSVLTRFSIVGVGDTVAAAFEDMDEAMVAYLEWCAEEGVPFDSVVRPLPFVDRLRMRASAALGSALENVFRRHKPHPVRAGFSRAHPDHVGPAHAPAIC